MLLDDAGLAAAAASAGLTEASAVVIQLSTRTAIAALNPDRPVYPASMIKVPLVAAALAEAEAGRYGLDDTFEIDPANMTANDAGSPLVPGYRATLAELAGLAIANSDNVATNVLFDVVGRERATAIAVERFGLGATRFCRKLSGSEPLIADAGWDGIHRNAHPAGDAARLFELVALDEVPFAGLLRDMLAAQVWNEKLSRGLRLGDRFFHKTGDTDEVTHDGGILIVREDVGYAIVVYAAMPSNDANNARFALFMREVRNRL
jgi:beta-lactamase class A